MALVLFSLVCLVALIALARTPIRKGMHNIARFAGGFAGGYQVRDGALKLTKTLPSGASTVYSDGFDLGATPDYGATDRSEFLAKLELLLTAPALAVGQLANASTMIYAVQTDSDAAFGSPTTIMAAVLTQTGANGAGAASATYRFRLPSTVERYVRFSATNSAAADASGASATLEMLF